MSILPFSLSSSSTRLLQRPRQRIWSLVKSRKVQWAASGWIFFVAENAVLSENRTYLIAALGGDETYHLLYGTVSTAATASIAYGYYLLTSSSSSSSSSASERALFLWNPAARANNPPPIRLAVAWTAMTAGLIMAFQALPKMQIPIALVGSSSSTTASTDSNDDDSSRRQQTPSSSNRNLKLQVRCPFDFSENKKTTTTQGQASLNSDYQVSGLDRISRHAGLWSFGFVGIGNALVQPYLPLHIWWMGPALVAWLGGWHTDSRFRRNMGGTLDPFYESQTSNVPFWAMISGKQGNVPDAFSRLMGSEIIPTNAALATGISTLWILLLSSRGKGSGRAAAAATLAAMGKRP